MPAETYSKTALNVADHVKRQFGDPDGRQITNNDILGWINIAQQEIISQNPILKETLVDTTVAGQDLYTYPTDEVQYIESIHVNGVPLTPYTFQEAQQYILSHTPTPSTNNSVPAVWYERNGSIYLYPTPSSAWSLRMFYVKRPEDLTNPNMSELLSIPDRYFQRIVDLVLAKAYQLDENWEAAQFKQSEYFSGMNLLANQENVAQTNTYPTIFVRDEDL